MAYQIWAFTLAGAQAAVLENAKNIQLDTKINSAPTLTFSLPADDAKAAFLTPAYEVKVWNSTKKQFEGLYALDDPTETWNSSGFFTECNYSGVLAQLAKEDNISYDTTSTPKTPTAIVTALLAKQERTPAITVGTIEPTTAFAVAVENTNILKALLECVSYMGGRIEVDADRHLNWYNEPAGNPVREIRYRKNMKGVTRKRDFTSIVNKLYAYGFGEPDNTQVKLTDAGEAAEYIQDATSQTAYGVHIKRITDKRIIHPATLLRWAQKVLAEYKDPVYYYTVDAVNLAVHPDFSFDFENLEIGQIIRVVNSDMNNLNVNVKVCGISTNLSRPEDITLELANVTKTLSDSIGGTQSAINLVQNTAVQIGAGQVTVQGTFTVDGWRTSGQTTIDGGKITANSVTVNQLNFTPVSSTNVVASINASAEGITINANRIKINGDCTFTAGYDPTGKVAAGGSAADVNAGATTISGGKITANTIDCAALKTSTLSAKTITLDNAGAGCILKSSNYSAGVSGWQIKGDGTAEFANVTVRGTIYATSGEFAGTIKASTLASGTVLTVVGAVRSNNYVLNSSGWELSGNGTISGTAAHFMSAIDATSIYLGPDPSSPNMGCLYSTDGSNLRWQDKDGVVRVIFT